jgi:hypothetical protein
MIPRTGPEGMMSVQELYEAQVRPLPINERLRLAALILDDLAETQVQAVDAQESWSAGDLRDVTAASLSYAASQLEHEPAY